MKRWLLLAFLAVLSPWMRAQTPDHASLIVCLKALGDAGTDAARDSLSERVRKDLRAILDRDDAFAADLSDLPMSRVDAPDGKFRLFSWNIPYDNGTNRYEGFLLVRDKDHHALYELRDMTEKIQAPATKKLGPDNWYGALYYAVIPPQDKKAGFYTLLGWKGYSNVETRKVIEVLSFKGTVPTFGGMVFSEGKVRQLRKIYGFSAQSTMSLKWDAANKAIVLDHLSPMRPEFADQPALLGPDLSFDAYVWYKGKWSYLRDVDARNMNITKPSRRPPPEP